jgi:NADPH2:quinone reductase
MEAIQIEKVGGPEVLRVVDLPIPQPKPNEALVKVSASGVNFIDTYHREGRYKMPLPFVLGQEGAGVVTQVGSEVESIKPGDRVAWTSIPGSYAEYVAVPAERLVPVPDGVSDQQAAAAMLQGMTAHYLSHDTYPCKARRDSLDSRRSRGGGSTADANGTQNRSSGNWNGIDRGKGEASAKLALKK